MALTLESRIEKLEQAIGGIRKVVVRYPGDAEPPDDDSVKVFRVSYVRPVPQEDNNES